MKIENLMEKDTVLDDDYLIVNGTDGTKKAKKSNFLSELNSSSGLYTPQIYWSESSEPLTVDNVSVRWYKMGNLCIIGGRFNVADVGNPGNSQLLTISLPDDITLEPTDVMIIGRYISPQEDLYVRGNGNTLSVVHDIGGSYSSQYIVNGYQGFTIVAFCQ